MNRYQLYTLLLTLIVTPAMAQKVTMKAKLSPAGSFNIEGKKLKGTVVKKGTVYSGNNIILDLTDLKSGMDLRDKHIQDYFETKKFPQAILVSGQGKDKKFTGNLKIRGITKPVSGTFEIAKKIGKALFKVKMSDFKIKKANYMGLGVKDEIEVEVEMPVPN